MKQAIKIGKRLVGDGCPVFVIAEAGINHNDDIVTKSAEKAEYQKKTTGSGET